MHAIELEIQDNIVTEMVLCHDEKWLICAHSQGMVTFINTEDMSFNTLTPFEEEHGHIESIYGVKRIDVEFVAIFEKLIFNTSNGIYTGVITSDGQFQTADVFF